MKKERSPEQKRKDRIFHHSLMSGVLIMALIICLYGLVSMTGTLIDVADITLDKLDEAKNLTFPANETRRNSLIGQFTFVFSGTGMLILLIVGLSVLVMLTLPFNLRGAWEAYKRRPTLEDRVEFLEKVLAIPAHAATVKALQEALKILEERK